MEDTNNEIIMNNTNFLSKAKYFNILFRADCFLTISVQNEKIVFPSKLVSIIKKCMYLYISMYSGFVVESALAGTCSVYFALEVLEKF